MKKTADIKHINIKVSGKVQGVNYRGAAKEVALKLGVKGSVRNMKDGTVIIEAEGTELILNQLVAWCQAGPPIAEVSKIEVTEAPLKSPSSFTIIF